MNHDDNYNHWIIITCNSNCFDNCTLLALYVQYDAKQKQLGAIKKGAAK